MEWRIKLFRDKLDSLSTIRRLLIQKQQRKDQNSVFTLVKILALLWCLYCYFEQISRNVLVFRCYFERVNTSWASSIKETKRHTFSDSLNALCISSWFSAGWFWFRFPMNKKAAIGRRYSVKTAVLKNFEYSQMRC